MSYDFIIYAQHDRLPAPEDMRAALIAANPPVEIDAGTDLRRVRGFVPARYDGKDSGFELRVSPIGPEDVADYQADLESSGEADDGFLSILEGNDTCITLSAKTDDEIAVASLVANALARLSGGVFSDPQTGVDR